jgi:site-specific DNA-methyltransferase (adenine-specific)
MDTNRIITGDCFEQLRTLPAESIEACVTDPPYGLAFMGRDWDDFEPKEYQEWCEKWATEVKRVLKPGAHLVAFSGNRTHHRLFSGVQDAGFEIRDTLTWHYGSGFPKASDISKTIDKRADAEREVVGKKRGYSPNRDYSENQHEGYQRPVDKERPTGKHYDKTEPATDAALEWDGWKTGLKPATEFIVLARKPFDGATVDCVLENGTGALNIDGTRIGGDVDTSRENSGKIGDGIKYSEAPNPDMTAGSETGGRYPANVVFDEEAAEQLDRKVGELGGGDMKTNGDIDGSEWDNDVNEGYTEGRERSMFVNEGPDDGVRSYGDSGGPSRYFYTSKASKSERTENGQIENTHPTVKPVDLMEWLVTLVTRENQTLIDPFCGTGTTCKAAKNLNREFIGIEEQSEWADVARVRAGLTPNDPSVVRGDNSQTGLENY